MVILHLKLFLHFSSNCNYLYSLHKWNEAVSPQTVFLRLEGQYAGRQFQHSHSLLFYKESCIFAWRVWNQAWSTRDFIVPGLIILFRYTETTRHRNFAWRCGTATIVRLDFGMHRCHSMQTYLLSYLSCPYSSTILIMSRNSLGAHKWLQS